MNIINIIIQKITKSVESKKKRFKEIKEEQKIFKKNKKINKEIREQRLNKIIKEIDNKIDKYIINGDSDKVPVNCSDELYNDVRKYFRNKGFKFYRGSYSSLGHDGESINDNCIYVSI